MKNLIPSTSILLLLAACTTTDPYRQESETSIEVSGHTDSTGSDNYNQLLSASRANSVAANLRAGMWIPAA